MQATLSPPLSPSIFRAYDIRGIVGQTLSAKIVFSIGKALGSFVREQSIKKICIARDGRLSGPVLSEALCRGLRVSGCDVIDLGMVPTPILYYAASKCEGYSGVMLTGSHNPPDYNGLKMVVNGVTLADQAIFALYERILAEQFSEDELGDYRESHLMDDYTQQIVNQIHLKRPLKIVVDAGNGVGGCVAPQLFRALGCDVQTLFCEVDGRFPNHHPDPSQMENLQDLIHTVRATNADIGLALDGDADRLGVVTNQGEVILPDRLLMAFAKDVLAKHPCATILYDVKCTQQLDAYVRQYAGQPLMWKTGHSLIKAKMRETHALLAGEMSGHFFFKDAWHGGDDALYAGARLLEILSHAVVDSTTYFAQLPNSVNTPELKVPIAEEDKFSFVAALVNYVKEEDVVDVITLDGLRAHFKDGWGLVRASNTSPYLVLRFEADDVTALNRIQNLFKQWMLAVKSDLDISFI
ncbi:MAG: phosphoglucomutase [Gammaproteobacteria bacterium RIFCSPHIGHO2_12_FULL_42_10]|nr:MAG: phosphoglucomutase [Gammaproteobacteria bacterium RIFCSPHIGHO2_12_FULL_42_10]